MLLHPLENLDGDQGASADFSIRLFQIIDVTHASKLLMMSVASGDQLIGYSSMVVSDGFARSHTASLA
jgi:hypothetical protein